MHRIVVVSGPTKGAIFQIKEGETSIGRQDDNGIVLPSGSVSRRHCSLQVMGDQVTLVDVGSSNGVFVNGQRVKEKRLKSGDRIGVGEFVFELVSPKIVQEVALPTSNGDIQSLDLGGGLNSGSGLPGISDGVSSEASMNMDDHAPTELMGKLAWRVERKIMPFFYGLLLKYEWKGIATAIFFVFIVLSLILSVNPLLQTNRQLVVKESGKRARGFARLLVEKNYEAVASGQETKTDIGIIEREDGVRAAVLIDLKQRVIAPSSKANQYLANGPEAKYALTMIKRFGAGKEQGDSAEIDETVVGIEPLKVYDPATGKNNIRALAVVSIDSEILKMDIGAIGIIFSETFIITALLGGMILYFLYRLTLKPLEVLNDDLDRSMKGEISQVTHEFKFSEIRPLIDLINSTIQRLPKDQGSSGGGGDSVLTPEEVVRSLAPLSEIGNFGFIVTDLQGTVNYVNSHFEDFAGIRNDGSIGQTIGSVARDQAFASVSMEMIGHAASGASQTEDFEFSGVPFRLVGVGFGVRVPSVCVIFAMKKEVG